MKTLFTFQLIIAFLISSYAQNLTTANQKTESQAFGITAKAPSFTIDKVYPNPVKDVITIELQSDISGSIKVSLFNILGSEIKKWDDFFLYQGDQKLKIDLSSFKNGVYILKISNSDLTQTKVLKKT